MSVSMPDAPYASQITYSERKLASRLYGLAQGMEVVAEGQNWRQ